MSNLTGQTVTVTDADNPGHTTQATITHEAHNGLTGHHIIEAQYTDGRTRYHNTTDIQK